MWVILPVKAFANAKLRLAEVLEPDERAQLSALMLRDIAHTLQTSADVEGVTMISSEPSLQDLAGHYAADFVLTDEDKGYSHDAMRAIASLGEHKVALVAIIPADVPQLSHRDLSRLKRGHVQGLTLCPAIMDGGTNGLVFTPPLAIPLLFGIDSLNRYRHCAEKSGIPTRVEAIAGLERDIDRREDLLWLQQQPGGGQAWAFVRSLDIAPLSSGKDRCDS